MKKACVLFSSAVVLLVLLIANSKAYVYRGHFDTSNGFCEEERYGRIPVGGVGYDDERCEEIRCHEGGYWGAGCGSMSIYGVPNCRLVRGTGRYPKCCKQVQCD
ncbi:SVWC domain-containing protein [Caerostris darwini]|uniref:SVWC domain-containing protein n=1 Tax=Caerostris darwini TaxID=1538125 RepID=A0AAV4UWX5_9ARAC|nr:SVWC domain-containing protein [Caerostris darwini]